MDFFEGLFYMIWRGIAIGILISAPMGPVGILCIQRTLDKGRWTGFYTGIGAALSDLFYCLLTGFGLSFIEEFLERNQNVIQLLGSAVLIGFGIFLFRKDPSITRRQPTMSEASPKKNILGGFLFTFSNPLILFLIIGLFARFNFLLPEIRFYQYIVGFIAILAGALGWWWLVTFSIDKVRTRFSLRTMRAINRTIGIVLMGFAVVGIVTGISNLASAQTPAHRFNAGRGYAPFHGATPQGVKVASLTDVALTDSIRFDRTMAGMKLTFRADNRHAHPGKRYQYKDSEGRVRQTTLPSWGVLVRDSRGKEIKLWIGSEETPEPEGSRQMTILTLRSGPDNDDVLLRKPIDGGILAFHGESLWQLTLDDGRLAVSGGQHEMKELITTAVPLCDAAVVGFMTAPGGELLFSDISAERMGMDVEMTVWEDQELLDEYLGVSQDNMEGYWEIFDRSLDESLLSPGGSYRLAIVKDRDGYDIIYISGARVNGKKWRAGMRKGRLTPTAFSGIYNLEWIDAEGNKMQESMTAQSGEGKTLNLQFPYQNSSLRLRRLP